MISWQRLIFILGLAVVEATPPALLLTIAGGDAWAPLVVVTLVAALADWLAQGWLPAERQRPALLAVGALLALWMVKGQVSGDYGLGAWGQGLDALLSLDHPLNGRAYVTLLCSLYVAWRGSVLLAHDSVTLRELFGRASLAMLLLLGLASLVLSAETALLTATLQVLAFFAVGLIVLALGSASAEHDTQLRQVDWRGLLMLCGTIALVLALGMALLSLFGTQAAQIIGLFARAITLLLTIILAPLVFVLISALEWLFRILQVPSLAEAIRELMQPPPDQQQPDYVPPQIMPDWMRAMLQIFLAALPVLLLGALILIARRNARRRIGGDEERESLWSWSGLADDLRALLGRLRNPFGGAEGLRAALARLAGADPASRIRRSYIRLLLAGEAHERPRTPPQTPREYEPTADTMIPTAARPIATLTGAYERARYHPTTTTDADADAAERAWNEIDNADRR